MLPKTLPPGHNCLWTSKTGSSAAGTFSYSRKTRSYQFSTTSTQLPTGFKPTKHNKLHYTTPTHNNSRLTHLKQTSGQNNMHFATKLVSCCWFPLLNFPLLTARLQSPGLFSSLSSFGSRGPFGSPLLGPPSKKSGSLALHQVLGQHL